MSSDTPRSSGISTGLGAGEQQIEPYRHTVKEQRSRQQRHVLVVAERLAASLAGETLRPEVSG